MSPPSLGGATGGNDESDMKVTKSEKTQGNRTAKSLGSVTELMTSLGSSEAASGPTSTKSKKTKSFG